MKKALLLCCSVMFMVASQVNCYTGEINVLSSEYHVWGGISGELIQEPHGVVLSDINRGYNETSSSPISRSLDLTDLGVHVNSHHASSTTDLFSLGVSAVDGFGHHSPTTDPDTYVVAASDASAEASWTFETSGNNLSVDFGIDLGYACRQDMWLTDLTDGTELFHGYSSPGAPNFSVNLMGQDVFVDLGSQVFSFNILVDPTHDYAITMYARAYPGGNAISKGEMIVDVSCSVPEPATILLIGTMLFGIAGCRIRKKFKK